MADTDFAALPATNTLEASDQLVVMRAGVPYRFAGALPAVAATGAVSVYGALKAGGSIERDPQFYLEVQGTVVPYINFDAGDQITYDRLNNKWFFVVGGVVVASIDGSGNLRVKGSVTPNASTF